MSSVIFPSPSNVRSVIIEDVCSFSVSGLLTKNILHEIKINDDSKILVLGAELHPSFPTTADSWKLLIKHEYIEYQSLMSTECDIRHDFLANVLSKIETFSGQNKTKNIIVIINITFLLLTHPASNVSRLLRKLHFIIPSIQ